MFNRKPSMLVTLISVSMVLLANSPGVYACSLEEEMEATAFLMAVLMEASKQKGFRYDHKDIEKPRTYPNGTTGRLGSSGCMVTLSNKDSTAILGQAFSGRKAVLLETSIVPEDVRILKVKVLEGVHVGQRRYVMDMEFFSDGDFMKFSEHGPLCTREKVKKISGAGAELNKIIRCLEK